MTILPLWQKLQSGRCFGQGVHWCQWTALKVLLNHQMLNGSTFNACSGDADDEDEHSDITMS